MNHVFKNTYKTYEQASYAQLYFHHRMKDAEVRVSRRGPEWLVEVEIQID